MNKLLGISGKLGSGKDTLAQFIQEIEPSYEIKKFAGKLKQITGVLCGVDPARFEDQEFKKQMSPFDMTYRELLQKVGTEAMRNQIHTDVWVRALFAEFEPFSKVLTVIPPIHISESRWLITDVRFPNEADAIKQRGGLLIRIYRNPDGPQSLTDLHPSETALDDYPHDITINNNGSLEDLKEQVRIFMDDQTQ